MLPNRTGLARPFDELREEFDRLWSTLRSVPPRTTWPTDPGVVASPAVNVAESEDAITIEAEVPGLDAGDVEIAATAEEVVLKGTRVVRDGEAGGNGDGEPAQRVTWHRRERSDRAFERRIVLPVPIDTERVTARLTDGVLTVTCPKSAQAQPRKVEVRTA
jgi:HSP20 family protein